MDNVDLYVFSGTGNTLKASKYIRDAFLESSISCKIFEISSKTDTDKVNLNNTLGIAFPIACFCTYPVVLDFINKLPNTECKTKLFFFSTMGGSDGQVCAQLTPIFEAKGYDVIGYEGFIMPSNFMQYKFNKTKNNKLFDICKKRANEYVKKLLLPKSSFKYKGKISSKIYSLIYKFSFNTGFIQKTFPVKVDKDKCTGCGICVDSCPVNNIAIVDNKAVFSDNCQDCMRCSGFCPEDAIRVYKSKPYSECSYSDFFSAFDK